MRGVTTSQTALIQADDEATAFALHWNFVSNTCSISIKIGSLVISANSSLAADCKAISGLPPYCKPEIYTLVSKNDAHQEARRGVGRELDMVFLRLALASWMTRSTSCSEIPDAAARSFP